MGHIADMLGNKKLKPKLQVSAYVSPYGAVEAMSPMEDTKYLKRELKMVKEEIAATKKALDNWIPEDVAERAERALRKDLKSKEARLAELSARLDAAEEASEDEDEDEEDED